MMQDNGEVMMQDIIGEAVQLRRKTASLAREFAAKGDWFFDLWQPRQITIDGGGSTSATPRRSICPPVRSRGS